MMRRSFVFFLFILLSMSPAQGAQLHSIKDKKIVEDLNGIISMTENSKNSRDIAVTIFRIAGLGECDGSDYGKDCPQEKLLISVSESKGEYPDMALYRTDGMYNIEFVRWRPDVRKAEDKHGYVPVVFEVKAQKGGQNYKLTDVKYLISVTPWSSQVEIIK
jgi:hypothetical protein